MFSTSSQRRRWVFESETELRQLRHEANEVGINNFNKRQQGKSDTSQLEALTAEDEIILVEQYCNILLKFCDKFNMQVYDSQQSLITIDLPPSTVATSMCYLQRFYLYHSVMEFHPREIMLTALYLAAKVDEFVISRAQFAKNVPRRAEHYANIVVNSELFLIDALGYDLVVHTAYRPLEGFLLDFAVHSIDDSRDPMSLRHSALDFLRQALITDAALLFPPSQIALAALRYALDIVLSDRDSSEVFEEYCRVVFLANVSKEEHNTRLQCLTSSVDKICRMVRDFHLHRSQEQVASAQTERLKVVEELLVHCRNPAHDPDSTVFQEQERRAQERFGDLLDHEASSMNSPGRPVHSPL